MSIYRAITAAAAIVLLTAFASAQDQETRIERAALPPAVEKTVVEQSQQSATIRGFTRERENGHTFYEAELMVNGHSKDLLMDAGGAVVEVEEQIPVESLPPAVRDALQAKAGSGKLVKVETLTKHGQLVAYEAQVLTHGKRSEVQVGPDGRPLDHEE